jgi:hypothetical protein
MAVVLDLVNLEPDGGSGRQGGSPKDARRNTQHGILYQKR